MLRVNGLHVDRLGKLLRFCHFGSYLKTVEAVCIEDLVVKCIDIHIAAGGADGQSHNLTRGILVELLVSCIQNRRFDVKGYRGGNINAVETGTIGIQLAFYVIQIQIQIIQQRDMMGGNKGGFLNGFTLFVITTAAVIVGFLHDRIDIQLCACVGRGEVQNRVRQNDHHIRLGVGVIRCFMEYILCFVGCQTAQVDAADHHIVENQTVICRPSKEIPDTDNHTDQKNHCDTANGNQDDLTVFACRCCGFLLTDGFFTVF